MEQPAMTLDIRDELDAWIKLDDDPAVTETCRRARLAIARAEAFNMTLVRYVLGMIDTTEKSGAPTKDTLIYCCKLMLKQAAEASDQVGKPVQ